MRCWWWLVLLLVTACESPLVRPNERVEFKSFSLSSPITWTQLANGRERIWTIDGPALNRLWLIDGVKPGENVFLRPLDWGKRRGNGAIFQAGIADSEAIELIADGLASFNLGNVQTRNARPFRFGRHAGFAFELAFDSASGLHYSGFGVGEIADDTMSFALYFATAEYYFGRDQDAARATLESIQSK